MLLKDFEYAGRRLSEFDCIMCYLTNDSGISEASIGCDITFNTVKNNHSSISQVVSTKYDSVYSTSFQIMKYKCDNVDDYYLTDVETRKLIKWLNRRSYEKFTVIYEDGSYSDVHYYGSFNIQEIKMGNQILGLSLTFTANAPYGFGEDIVHTYELLKDGETKAIECDSDEFGYIYPTMEITIKEDGDFVLTNKFDEKVTEIKNCIIGEIITLDGEHKIIKSSIDHIKLYNDFNYEYPAISNEYELYSEDDMKQNIYTASLPCSIKIKYSPIRKIGVV